MNVRSGVGVYGWYVLGACGLFRFDGFHAIDAHLSHLLLPLLPRVNRTVS